jgi:TonB family protein
MPFKRVLGAVVLGLSSATAQPSKSVNLNWSSLSLVLSPNVGGVYVWAESGENEARRRTFADDLDPAEVREWVSSARSFLATELAARDTGTTRLSPVITGLDGGKIYLARRREQKGWVNDPILVFLPDGEKARPILAKMESKSVLAVLDSLERLSRDASPARSLKLHDSTGAEIKTDANAYLRQGSTPPAYPEAERLENHTGMVLLQFVIGVDGRVDFPTIQVLHSTSPAFLESTLRAVTAFRFNPATFNGKPVRQLVVMPFNFGLRR